MTKNTFKNYLLQLSEDTNTSSELDNLNLQRQQLVIKKTNADKQIDQQIDALDKLIYQKQQQLQQQNKQQAAQQPQQPAQPQPQQPQQTNTQQPQQTQQPAQPQQPR